MLESIEQLKSQRLIEDMENMIFCAERGMPAHPRVIETMKLLLAATINEYNENFVRGEVKEQKEQNVEIKEKGKEKQ
jgi:hypothetical protein